jgi:hypothetical protein
MAIIVGDSTDGVRTGLAGRIANDIVAAFAGVTYATGTNHQKGVNALVQGIVDALNNDKVGTDQVQTKTVVLATVQQTGSTGFPQASGFLDLPNATTGTNGYTGTSTTRQVRARLSFSAFASAANVTFQVRVLVDGVVTGAPTNGPYQNFYNTTSQHQAWSYVWNLGALAAGAHTIKVQLQCATAGQSITVDANDHVSFEVEEIG